MPKDLRRYNLMIQCRTCGIELDRQDNIERGQPLQQAASALRDRNTQLIADHVKACDEANIQLSNELTEKIDETI